MFARPIKIVQHSQNLLKSLEKLPRKEIVLKERNKGKNWVKIGNGSIIVVAWTRGWRSTTTIYLPSHIILMFSYDPPQNPRPSIIMIFKCRILEDIFWKSGHVRALNTVRLNYCNDYNMKDNKNLGEWCQTLFRWKLNLST